jgi:hypothetical protein
LILPAFAQEGRLYVTNDPALATQEWLALICTGQACWLRSTTLTLDPDGCAQDRSLLVSLKRQLRLRHNEAFIALVARSIASPGPLKTAFNVRTPRRPEDAAYGSLGVALNMLDAEAARLIPRWNDKTRETYLTVYLETATRRQALGRISFEALHQGLKPHDILLWTGDLDGDGKVDLITQTATQTDSSTLSLWLSGQAKPNELVGLASSVEGWREIWEDEGC